MPIQWSGQLTGPQALASVIQGEAATPAGQFAVASVMYNRVQNGGFGSGILGVVTPSNFNGWNNNPSPYAQSLANDLWSGNAPQGGSTGNALYFAAPSSANAAWANPNTAAGQAYFASGTNIGGNYFSDNQGPASANFSAPVYGGSGSTIASGPAGQGFGGNGDSITSAGTADPYAGDYTTTYPDPNTAFDTSGGASAAGSGSSAAGTSSAVGTSSASPTGDVGQGTPVTQGLQQGTIAAVGGWISNIESAFGSGLKSAVTAAENAVGTWFGSIQNWFVRAFLIIVGIVIVFAALIALMWDHGGKETIVQMGKAAAA